MGGGVLIISHNKEFCDGVATEKWIMRGGYLRIEGESKEDVSEEQTSGDKERKKKIKDLEKKLKDGKKKKTLSDEECWELEDQLKELQEGLKAWDFLGTASMQRLCLSAACAVGLPSPV